MYTRRAFLWASGYQHVDGEKMEMMDWIPLAAKLIYRFFFLSANTMQVNKCSILCEFKLLFFIVPISPKQLLFIIDSKRLYLLLYFSKSLM